MSDMPENEEMPQTIEDVVKSLYVAPEDMHEVDPSELDETMDTHEEQEN